MGARSRLEYVEAAWAAAEAGGYEAFLRFIGTDVSVYPTGAEKPMRGAEAIEWAREQAAAGARRTASKPTYEEFGDCILARASVRIYEERGFFESTRTLLFEFDDEELIRVTSYGSPEVAKLSARAGMWRRPPESARFRT